jgi:hypothetical protein
MDLADRVNTKDLAVLMDLAAQANGRAEAKPISKAVLASPADLADRVNTKDLAVLGAATARANRPFAAKTHICLSASKSIRRHAGDETGITDYLCAQNAGSVLHKAEGR